MNRRFFIEFLESMIDDLDDIKQNHHMYFLETTLINGIIRFLELLISWFEN